MKKSKFVLILATILMFATTVMVHAENGKSAPAPAQAAKVDTNKIVAPVAGPVTKINVAQGDQLKVGDTILVIGEADSATVVESKVAANVKAVSVKEGDVVKAGDALIEKTGDFDLKSGIEDFLTGMGLVSFFSGEGWKSVVMLLIGCVLLYLAIKKEYEPLLLLPIAFGMILSNLPGAGLFDSNMWNNEFLNSHSEYFHDYGHILAKGGLLDVLYIGVKAGIYPCLIFLGVGAMTDFGPLIANPKSLLLGAAAQLGIFATFLVTQIGVFGFTLPQSASIGIIGGADGPTAIFLTSKLAPELLGPIAVAAYSYMALVPVIQPPIMRALTSKKERMIRMKQLRTVSKKEKIIFPIVVAIVVSLIVPSAGTLIGCLMLGNLFKESGVVERLSKAAQNELNNIVVIMLGTTVGATATASSFLNFQTLSILCVGIVAFGIGTAGGVIMAKIMNLFLKEKINPLIGSAGVSAVPMAARVSQVEGQKADPRNFLLMHAMGPNVAGVIGSAVAAGILLSFLG